MISTDASPSKRIINTAYKNSENATDIAKETGRSRAEAR